MVYFGFRAPTVLFVFAVFSMGDILLSSRLTKASLAPSVPSPSSERPLIPTLSSSANLSATSVPFNQAANVTGGGQDFQCHPKYGVNLGRESCRAALAEIPTEAHQFIFGRRTRPQVQLGLPYRFLSGTLRPTSSALANAPDVVR